MRSKKTLRRRYLGPALGSLLLLSLGFTAARLLAPARGPEKIKASPDGLALTSASQLPPRRPLPPPLDAGIAEAGRPAPARDGSTAALIEWARRAVDNGRYTAPPGDNLVDLLARIESVSPNHPEARALRTEAVITVGRRGREALTSKDLAAALGYHRVLLALQSDSPFPRSDLSHQLQLQARANARKNHRKALESGMGAVEVTPESVPAHLILGDVYLLAGQRELAAAEYRRSLELHPYPAEEKMARAGLQRAEGPPKRRHR